MLAAIGLWASERPPSGPVLWAFPLWAAAWLLRWLRLGRPTRSTPLDWPLLIFGLTALVGLWAAPDRGTALVRLDFLLGAAGLYYALANSPAPARPLFAYGLGFTAALLALYFASQNNWTDSPAKFALVGQVGRLLNRLTPQWHLYQPNGNVVANLLALALPVPVVQAIAGFRAWSAGGWARRLAPALAAGLALVILFGLVMTESRASALALGGTAALAAWWWLAGRAVQRSGRGRAPIFAAGVGAAALVVVLVAIARPNVLTAALGSLPGPNSAISRTELYGQAWRLAQDAPYTGGGLGAFPGLYSTYILDVPNLYLTHAHNAYLNVLVEQGWPGLIGFVAVLAAAMLAGLRQLREHTPGDRPLVIAGLLGLAVLMLQALGDGTLLASRVELAWLVPAGLAVGAWVSAPGQRPLTAAPAAPTNLRRRLGWALAICAVVAGLGLLTWHSWLAAWYADLSSVSFARIQLESWPTNQWSDGHEAPQLAASEPELNRALALQPSNVTALYRLGILAGLQRNFPAAVTSLSAAHRLDPGHRGVLKALAYAYVWAGDSQDAGPLLKSVPEAANEMAVYTWWWGTQGHPDLAERARLAAAQLAAAP